MVTPFFLSPNFIYVVIWLIQPFCKIPVRFNYSSDSNIFFFFFFKVVIFVYILILLRSQVVSEGVWLRIVWLLLMVQNMSCVSHNTHISGVRFHNRNHWSSTHVPTLVSSSLTAAEIAAYDSSSQIFVALSALFCWNNRMRTDEKGHRKPC